MKCYIHLRTTFPSIKFSQPAYFTHGVPHVPGVLALDITCNPQVGGKVMLDIKQGPAGALFRFTGAVSLQNV